jgi:ubiquitin carboxyl-terminal hydrolase 25/28
LGFEISDGDGTQKETQVIPPNTDLSTPSGKQNRAKLLRAWVEIGAWLKDYTKTFGA